jgi:hypothetical protein
MIDTIGIEEKINQLLGTQPGEKVSPGQAVKAMILNGLGLVSAPLYLFSKFFEGKALMFLRTCQARVHECPECGYKTDRDVAAAQVVRNRGVSAVGQTVDEIACGRDASGTGSSSLDGTERDRNFLEAILGSPFHNL